MKRLIYLCFLFVCLLWGCSAQSNCEALEAEMLKAAAADMKCSEHNIDVIQHEQLDYFSVWLIKNSQLESYRLVSLNEKKPKTIVQRSIAAESTGFLFFEDTEEEGFGVIYLSNPKKRPLSLKLVDGSGHTVVYKDSMELESTLMISRFKTNYFQQYKIRVLEALEDISDTFVINTLY